MVITFVAALVAIMVVFPTAPFSRALSRVLVEPLAGWLVRTGRKRLSFYTFGALALFAVVYWIPDFALLAAAAVEPAVMIVTLVDAGIAVETLLAIWLLSVSGAFRFVPETAKRLAASISAAKRRLSNRRAAPRQKRSRQAGRPKPPANDSDPEPAWLVAA